MTQKFVEFCFEPAAFETAAFDAHQFLTAQLEIHTPLELLRQDLRRYGERLKAQLIDLLNRDYTDFISLSSNLEGYDCVVEYFC